MTVPALLPLLPGVLGVGFMELGIALSVFNVVSAVAQTPMGYAVDRFGARRLLMAGLALGSASFLVLAVFTSFEALVVVMGLAGIANCVYHPSDYTLLSRQVTPHRMGRAFSMHTFAGYIGSALAPVVVVSLALSFGVQWALLASSIVGGLALLAVWTVRLDEPDTRCPAGTQVSVAEAGAQRLAPRVVLALIVLFLFLSLSTGSIERFSVSALVQGFGIELQTANLALTAFLFASALGVLAGGFLADQTKSHGLVAAGAFSVAAALVTFVILAQPQGALLVAALGATGFLTGTVAPSRDMLVRASAPAGAEGRVFGLVSTGFNVGGVAGPLLFGYLLDNDLADAVLWATVGFMVTTTIIVLVQERRR